MPPVISVRNAIAPENISADSLGDAFRKAYTQLREELADPAIKSITLMIGVPGAGKSTYAEKHAADDILFFDAVSARPGHRKTIINIAKELGKPVDAIFLKTEFGECVKRNDARDENRRVPQGALDRARDLLKSNPPDKDEGFRTITEIDFFKKARYRQTDKLTRDYLEQALLAARKLLPGDMYAIIHQAALPRSGGRASARRRLTPLEKLFVTQKSFGSLSSSELQLALDKIDFVFAAAQRQDKPTDSILRCAKSMAAEVLRRGLEIGSGSGESGDINCVRNSLDKPDDAMTQEKSVGLELLKQTRATIHEPTIIAKGFRNGEPEAGFHAHALDRRSRKTLTDGGHPHIFVMPGTGEIFMTFEDGAHAHGLESPTSDATAIDGVHSHGALLPDGTFMDTTLGGAHSHLNMIETTGFSGPHTHKLVLADGTEIESLGVAEFLDLVGALPDAAEPLHSARQISNALNRAFNLEMEILDLLLSEDDAVMSTAQGIAIEFEDSVPMEVVKLEDDRATVAFSSGETAPFDIPESLDLDVGDIVDVDDKILKFSDDVEPMTSEAAREKGEQVEKIRRATKSVLCSGSDETRIAFVGSVPSPFETARGEGLVGPDGEFFQKNYLEPLGLTRDQISVTFVVPSCVDIDSLRPETIEVCKAHCLSQVQGKVVVTLGKSAREILGAAAHHHLPHPKAVRKSADLEKLQNTKLPEVRKSLDLYVDEVKSSHRIEFFRSYAKNESANQRGQGDDLEVKISKGVEEKRIIFGVVLDPYQVDLQEDWISPAEIESTSYGFMKNGQVIGLEHDGRAEGAKVVESFVEPYPAGERDKAFANLPHQATRRKFGNDVIHSGAWILGIELTEGLWKLHKEGKIDAFSIGGMSVRTKIPETVMPEVDFIDLAPK